MRTITNSVRKEVIVLVSPYGHGFKPSGAGRRLEAFCRELDKDKSIELVVLSPRPIGDCAAAWYYLSMDGGLASKAKGYWKMSAILRRLKPDLVISESPLVPMVRSASIYHLIHDAKFVTDLARKNASLLFWLHKLSCRLSHGVITVSGEEKKRLILALDVPADKIFVSPNGISQSWVRGPSHERIRKKFDLIYVANFAAHKGHMELLEVANGQEWRMVFVGSDHGSKRECIVRASELGLDCVFREDLSDSELRTLYDSSRYFVFPSHLEGFGIPYVEARARGLEVLGRRLPVFEELDSILGGFTETFGLESGAESAEIINRKLAECDGVQVVPSTIERFVWPSIVDGLLTYIRR